MRDIIVTTDLSINSDKVVKASYLLAKETGKKLTMLYIDELYTQVIEYNLVEHFPREYKKDSIWNRELEVTAAAMIEQQLERLKIPKENVDFHSIEGGKRTALDNFLKNRSIEIVTVGSNEHGDLYRFFLGSFSESVVFNSHCDCLLIKNDLTIPLKHVMVAIDLKNDNSYLLERVKTYAKKFNSSVSIIYALPINLVEYTDGDAEKLLNSGYLKDMKADAKQKIEAVSDELKKENIKVEGHLELELGKPVSQVIEHFYRDNPADLVFLSPHHSFMSGMAFGGVCYTLIKDLKTNFYITKSS